ncbi:UNVERIFIED_CONTAM: hypothetical protein K2H54_049374 [Gekko kuhli]
MTYQLTNMAPKTGKSTTPGTNSSTTATITCIKYVFAWIRLHYLLIEATEWNEGPNRTQKEEIQSKNRTKETEDITAEWTGLQGVTEKSGDRLRGIKRRRDRLVASMINLTTVFATSLAWHVSD